MNNEMQTLKEHFYISLKMDLTRAKEYISVNEIASVIYDVLDIPETKSIIRLLKEMLGEKSSEQIAEEEKFIDHLKVNGDIHEETYNEKSGK